MSPDGDNASPITKLPTGNGLEALQCTNCRTPQTKLCSTSERNSDALNDATLPLDTAPLWHFPQAMSPFNWVPQPPLT